MTNKLNKLALYFLKSIFSHDIRDMSSFYSIVGLREHSVITKTLHANIEEMISHLPYQCTHWPKCFDLNMLYCEEGLDLSLKRPSKTSFSAEIDKRKKPLF